MCLVFILNTENSNARILNYFMDSPSTASDVYYSGIFSNKFLLCYINRKYQDPIEKGIVLKRINARLPALTRPCANSYPIEVSNVVTEADSKLKNQKKNRHLKLDKTNKVNYIKYFFVCYFF